MNKQNEESLPAAVAGSPPCARDIDALVHERIMGLRPVKVWIATSDGGKPCCLSNENRNVIEEFLGHYENGMARGYSLGSWDRYPLYTEDPAASKMLRNKMRADGWKYRLYWNGLDFTMTMQRGSVSNNFEFSEAESDTEEMATAIAALRAAGILPQALPDGGAPQAKPE